MKVATFEPELDLQRALGLEYVRGKATDKEKLLGSVKLMGLLTKLEPG